MLNIGYVITAIVDNSSKKLKKRQLINLFQLLYVPGTTCTAAYQATSLGHFWERIARTQIQTLNFPQENLRTHDATEAQAVCHGQADVHHLARPASPQEADGSDRQAG